ncbi:unnamed protein product [Orchesella dallaii]|uniref:Odorant receptor n=1 Tax=Orchesella dallaii TaxID=48710 RepID=A0ABP1Q7E4_9HEXA
MEPVTEFDFMLSKFLLNVMKQTVKVTGKLGFCPLKLDTARGKFSVDTWRWARTVHNFLWLLCYAVVVLPTHVYEVYRSGNGVNTFASNRTVIYLLLATILSYLSVLFLGVIATMPLTLCQVVNSFYKFMETFPVKYIRTYNRKKEKRKMKMLEFVITGSTISVLSVVFLIVLHCYSHPTSSAYPAFRAYIPSHLVAIPAYILSSTWFSVSAISYAAVSNIVIIHAIHYFFYAFPIIRNELRRGRPRYKTLDILREPDHLVLNYRTLQVLVGIINTEICVVLIPAQALIIAAILVSNVSLAFQWELFTITTKIFLITVSVVFLVGWSIFLWMAGQQFRESKKTVASWKLGGWDRRFDRMYMKRVKRACQPICFGDGKRFLLNPTKVLLFINSVNRNSFKAFAMYRKIVGH